MKLAAIVLAALLAIPAGARADEVLHPPGGPVVVEAAGDGPVFIEADNPQAHAVPREEQQRRNRQLKRALMEQFDRNGDGRLGPRERMRAIRVLERIQRKLAGRDGPAGQPGSQQPGRPQRREPMRRRFIERFDTNGDGNVDRGEMPPGAARKLRRLDRDGDGWLAPNEAR